MERSILNVPIQKDILVREKTKVTDMTEQVRRRNWIWTGHVSRIRANQWISRITNWKAYEEKQSKRKPVRRRRDRETMGIRTTQVLEEHHLAEDSARQRDLDITREGLHPTTGHYGCRMTMIPKNRHQNYWRVHHHLLQ